MLEAIDNAKASIYWEIFIFVDDEVGNTFLDALIKKAEQGVAVKMIVDAWGSFYLSREAERRLLNAGVELLKYNALYPELKITNWIRRIFNRNHRKVLIIDEAKVFLGGVNVDVQFHEWDDLYVQITGPVARPLLRGFAKTYLAAGGNKDRVQHLLHPKLHGLQAWREKLDFIVHSPQYARSPRTHRLYIRALAMASETVNLITPYYVPNKAFLRSVALARKRGVKVNIFLPLRPDSRLAQLIGQTYYELTVKAGANLFFLPTMNHAKAVSVDKRFGAIGSMNLTRRAERFDQEAGVSFTDESMVEDLNKLFNMWREQAQPFDSAAPITRGWLERIQTWILKQIENFV